MNFLVTLQPICNRKGKYMATMKRFMENLLFWGVFIASIPLLMQLTPDLSVHRERSSEKELSERGDSARLGNRKSARPTSSFPRTLPPIDHQVMAAIRTQYGSLIERAADAHAVPAVVITAIIYEESKGNPTEDHPESHCKGLMQICDTTAREYDVRDVFDPEESISGGARIFAAYLRKKGGDFDKALVAYNKGPNSELFRNLAFDPAQHPYVLKVKRTMRYL